MYNILICDDERDIVNALKIYLSGQDYTLFEAYDGEQALAVAEKNELHLILMDIMMPKLDGLAATAKLREKTNAPILLLTAKSETADKVLGLNVGADDYVTKPFRPRELVSRVKSLLRRYRKEGALLTAGDFTLDPDAGRVFRGETEIRLSALEYRILYLLMANRGNTVPRERILDRIWDLAGNYVNDNTLTVYVKRIREKTAEDLIVTVKGVGYRVD